MNAFVHRSIAALSAVVLLAGCGGGGGSQASEGITPEAGLSIGRPPILDGQAVMVLPVQSTRGVPTAVQPEAEIVFALQERNPGTQWILPDELRRIQQRSPGVQLDVERLQVGVFLRAEVRRVGDPLYGQLRRLGAMTDADVALIPVRVRYRPESAETASGMEIATAVVNVRNGRVYWFGIVDGEPGEADDPRILASAADVLARTLAR